MIKELYFDVELIIDYSITDVMGENTNISTHRNYRGLKYEDLKNLINLNSRNTQKTTFIIRGVNY